jgi:hypothetical protein
LPVPGLDGYHFRSYGGEPRWRSSDTVKEVAALQDEAKQNSQLLKFLKDVEIIGVIDGYYSYNTNQVDMFTQGRAFDVRHNAFSLQLARIGFNKAVSSDSPLGFRLDVGLGGDG